MGTVKSNCNYALLEDLSRTSRTELTTSSLGGEYQGVENMIPKSMTHGISSNANSRVSWPAMTYLYAIWDVI